MASKNALVGTESEVSWDLDRRIGFIRAKFYFFGSKKPFSECFVSRKLTNANVRIFERSNAKWRRQWNRK